MRTGLIVRRGISMAETVISILLVGFVLVSTLQIVAPMSRSTSVHADRLVAANLAIELTEEIATKRWTSPSLDDPDSIGPEVGESRATYDDVDDYDDWSASPPVLSTGQDNLALTGWTRRANVDHVLMSDASTISGSYTGLKRITVIVLKGDVELARIESLHTDSADSLGFVVP